ncbi:MAG: hypothetical protein HFI50_15545 [Lachnospiraceae bacterium]|jgi:hypothetical protein|nr:hypothetical protein [Lachnospiraceae bacterium]
MEMRRKYGRNMVCGTLTEDGFNDMMVSTIHKLIEVAFFMSNVWMRQAQRKHFEREKCRKKE